MVGYRGRLIQTTGDGILATFDGPARAIRCAQAIANAVRPLDLEIRAGCHTGEIELAGNDVLGIAVHISARISALAESSQVLVSSTVKDLVAGSGLEFEDRGAHTLKGVPSEWRLYAGFVPSLGTLRPAPGLWRHDAANPHCRDTKPVFLQDANPVRSCEVHDRRFEKEIGEKLTVRASLQSPTDGAGATSPMTGESFSFAAETCAWRSSATPCVDVVNSASRTRLLT